MSDGDYRKDREFGDSVMMDVKAIMGQFLFKDNLTEEDCERNTDIAIPQLILPRIGVRIRRYKYYLDYPDEFTIRYERESDIKTEFMKIMEGYGDYFFYGFMDAEEKHLVKWTIGNYPAFRRYICQQMQNDWDSFVNSHIKANAGGQGSHFLCLKLSEIPGFVAADSDHWPPTGVTPHVGV